MLLTMRRAWVLVSICATALLALAGQALAATSSTQSVHEAPAVSEGIANSIMQSPGPMVVSKGGSGGTDEPSAPAGELDQALSSAYSDTWKTVGGPLVSRIYTTPVNYRGSDDAWHPIGDRLVATGLGGYENEANSFSLQIPSSLSKGVSLSSAGGSVSFALKGAREVMPSVSGETATYSEALASTDFEYDSISSGVQETATLKNTEAPSELRFALTTSGGLQPRRLSDGTVQLLDSAGTPWFTIPAPVAYRPSAGASTGRALPSTLTQSGSGWVLSIDTSASWLREMLASGPVAVDPTIEETGTQACTLAAEAPTTSYCSSTSFQEGYEASHQEHHGLLKFNLSSVPVGAEVLNAKLGLYVQSHGTSSSKAVGVYRVEKPWTTSATWETYDGTHAWTTKGGDYANPASESDASVNPSVGSATGWSYWYPTRMVQEWVNTENAPAAQGYANDGLIVKDQTDNATANLLTLTSPSASSNKPYLEVFYEPRGSSVEPQYTELSTPLTDKLNMSVNPASGNLTLESQDLETNGTNGVNYETKTTFNDVNPEVMDDGRWQDSNRYTTYEYPNGDIVLTDGAGSFFSFLKNADGTYVTPPGIKATLCTAGHTGCPASFPSGVVMRLVYNGSGRYVDFNSYGWAAHIADKYGNELTSGLKEGIGTIASWTDTQSRKFEYKVLPSATSFYTEIKDVTGSRNVKYGYEGEGSSAQLTSYTDAASNTTKYHYEYYDLTKVTTPKGNVVLLKYDTQHRIKEVIRTTNSEHTTGPTTKFVYYKLGEDASCTAKQTATVVRDPDWSEAKPTEHETTYCANVLDEVEKTIDAKGNETQASYDPFGNQSTSTAAAPGGSESGGTVNHIYGTAGQNLMCSVAGASKEESSCPATPNKSALVTTYGYADQKNLYSSTETADPQGNSQFACYNDGEQKESKGPACTESASGPAGSTQNKSDQLPEQNKLKFAYNEPNGTIKSSTDADGHTTEYLYENGNLKEVKPPLPLKATTIKVDADSRPEVITDGAEHKETITYDKLNRVMKIEYGGTGTARTVKFEYDADGNVLKREDSTETVKYTVDTLNRITKEELPESVTHTYEYDAASNMTSFKDGAGTTKYEYNGLSQLESMTEPEGIGTDKFSYDNDGHLTKITYPSKVSDVFKLEAATGRPEQITAEGTTGTTVPTLSYTYKLGENDSALIQTLGEAGTSTTTYSYDQLDRLTKAVTGGTSHPTFYKFKLDGAGNRLEQKVNLTKAEESEASGAVATYYAYNAANELECRQSVATPCSGSASTELSHYSYDGAGEETAITPKSDTSGTSFAFNAASQLATLTPSSESAYSLSYGGTGQNDLRSRGSGDELGNSLLGLTHENNNGSVSAFERTPNGMLIDLRTPSGNFNPLYDAQGDVIAMVNASTGKVERTFRYGPYGENVKSEGTQTVPYPFGYKGGYRMPGGNAGRGNVANGLIHFGERYYDPTTGRWTQRDPSAQAASLLQNDDFGFAGSDPVNLNDPSGKICVPLFFSSAGDSLIDCIKKGWELAEEAFENAPHCYPDEVEGGGQCSSAPPGDGNNPFFPILPEYP
jgi:RHS repeat-associated protein